MESYGDYRFLENLADLKNENALLEVVAKRYEHDKIYTFVGSSLLALNPNKHLEIYEISTVNQYLKNGPFSNEAHIFSVANKALRNLNNGSRQEALIFGGDAGSGKTTNVFHALRFIATANGGNRINCGHVNAIEVILSCFGSTKTLRNDHGTRFGYALNLQFQKNQLCGIQVTSMLPLELSQLIFQRSGESTFSVFYLICSGLNDERKEKLGLKSVSDYFYLNQGRKQMSPNVGSMDFCELENALTSIGFSSNQIDMILRLLATVLHVGNIYFQTDMTSSGSEVVRIVNETELKWISHLLEVDFETLKNVFLSTPDSKKVNDDLDSSYRPAANTTITSIDKALDIRDSFAKSIYHELFQWILRQISLFFKCSKTDATISVLDMFGFVRYNNNSFEELCVNAVNERIENLFIQKVFKDFQSDYEDEGISCDYRMPSHLDNERVVNMLFHRPCGIFPLLTDESQFPKGSDNAFLQRANINHLDKSIYGKPRSKDRHEFGVRHFAGMTFYNVEGFLQKNRWIELGAVRKLFASSENPSLALMVPAMPEPRNRTVYVAAEYASAVQELCSWLYSQNCQFVRCVRVGNDRSSNKFDAETVGRQMRALAVQENFRMSRMGFSHKLDFEMFLNCYRCLLPMEVITHVDPQKIVSDILVGQGNRFLSDFVVGSHSVFMKDRLLKQLDGARDALQDSAAIVVQRNLRMLNARQNYLNKKAAVTRIQAGARGWLARKYVGQMKEKNIEIVEKKADAQKMEAVPEKLKGVLNTESSAIADKIAPVAAVQWYEIPQELDTVLQQPIAMDRVKSCSKYLPLKVELQKPETDSFTIEEFAELFIKNHVLEARREPILTPFLPKDTDKDFDTSLKIFKLILRYMNDTSLESGKRCVLAKYIIQQGVENHAQRDEIYVQLCNQTYNNRNTENACAAWNLLLMAANSFPPGILVFPMIKNYFEQQAEPLSSLLLEGLFRPLRHPDDNRNRVFTSTALEQLAYNRRQRPVVNIYLPDGESVPVEVDAWSTIAEVVERTLRLRGLIDAEGWGLHIDNGKINSIASDQSFLFDALSQFEIPSVPTERSPFVNFETVPNSEPHSRVGSRAELEQNMRNGHHKGNSSVLGPTAGISGSIGKHRVTPEEYANMSVASRIRNMKIPAPNGDVNKFLDEVFDQVLPPSDEMPSNKAIAASIKGGPSYEFQRAPSVIENPPFYRSNGHPPPPYEDSYDPRQTPSQLSSINFSADEAGRDSRVSGSLPPPSRLLFTANRSNMCLPPTPSPPPADERVTRTFLNDTPRGVFESDFDSRPSTMMQIRSNSQMQVPASPVNENSRIGQLQPTSQRARYLGSDGLSPSTLRRPAPHRKFDSPAAERRARALNARSKSTPRAFMDGAPSHLIPPPDYDRLDDSSTLRRRDPRTAPQSRSTSSNGWCMPKQPSLDDSSDPRALHNNAVRKLRNRFREMPSPASHRREISNPSSIDNYVDRSEFLPSRSHSSAYVPERLDRSRTLDSESAMSQNGYDREARTNGHRAASANGQWAMNGDLDRETPCVLGDVIPKTPSTNGRSQLSSTEPPAAVYVNEPWKLTIRKELFFPGERLDDADTIDLVFSQIIADCRRNNPHRIRQFERDRINCILNKHRVPVASLDHASDIPPGVKNEVIREARKWPLYFCRMYPAIEEGPDERVSVVLGVGENGLRIMTRNVENATDPMTLRSQFLLDEIQNVAFEAPSTIKISSAKKVKRLTCNTAPQTVDFINRFLENIPKQKVFVVAVGDYQINKPNILSFRRSDIIQLVKPTREEAPSMGHWLYGKIGNRFGWFPSEYVQSAEEEQYSSEIYAPPSALNATYVAPSEFQNNSSIIYGSVNRAPDKTPGNGWNGHDIYGARTERLTMTEFALRYFRQPKSSDFGSLTLNRKKKDWSWQEVTDRVKFSEKLISRSLLRIESGEAEKLAVEAFACVMRYMSDLSLKRGQTVTDCVYELLSLCHNMPVLVDEVYCQVMKQTTANKSPRVESLLLGWRLFTILTAYFAASETLQPYLVKFLDDVAGDPRRPFNGTAALCLQNYQQTLQYGGRKFILTAAEVEALTSGKNVKRQAFELPGGQKRFISTRTITVVEEVVKELCTEMNVWSEAEQHEFSLCYILEKDASMRVLRNDDYILDVTSELETRNEKFTLILTRTVWIHPLREDNETYIDVLFFQIVPNYMAGFLTALKGSLGDQLPAKVLDDAATLAALLHLASDNSAETLSEAGVQALVPRTVMARAEISPEKWLTRIAHKLTVLPPQYQGRLARLEFLKMVEKWPLYGSSFYFVNKVRLPEKNFKNAVVAVNKDGLKVLSANNMDAQWTVALGNIKSSRKYSVNGNGYLDIQIKDETAKDNEYTLTIDTMEADSGSEIARVIGQYIYLNNQKTPPVSYVVNTLPRNGRPA